MLALEENVRTVVIFCPELLLQGRSDELITKFEEAYLEVKAMKQVYLTPSDAESFFHYLPAEKRSAATEAWSKGLSKVLVLDRLDGDVITMAQDIVRTLTPIYGEESIYCSGSEWESLRDLEFFFSHLGAMAVERSLALIKPGGLNKGTIGGQTLEQHLESELAAAGLFVVGKRNMALSAEEASILCEELQGSEDHNGSMQALRSDPGAIALCVEGPGAIGKLRLICGPRNSGKSKECAPTTLRACWGTDGTDNGVHCSSNMEAAEQELKALFPQGTLTLQRTLCIIKPHSMDKMLDIRMEIERAGFTVLKEKHTVLSEERASDFYCDHKAQPYFKALIQEAIAGTCALLVLCRLEAVMVLGQLMGPATVKDAKAFRPNSLRARFGRDGQKNAVHGSTSVKSAGWEVRFLFPELGSDPTPGSDAVRDYLFRKSTKESMDLKTLSHSDGAKDYTLDPTLQQLISNGLLALCQVKPKGLGAVSFFKDWLNQNNPNAASSPDEHSRHDFKPAARAKPFVEYGINQDGLPFSVEAPPVEKKKKKIIDVDVSQELEEHRVTQFAMPPYVAFVIGGAGASGNAHCAKLAKELNLVHLDALGLLQSEVAACSRLGTEAQQAIKKGQVVPDEVTLQTLKKAMLKCQDTNRFLLEGFPKSAEQAKLFEQEIASVAFVVSLEATAEDTQMSEDVAQVVSYYAPIGKVRRVSVDRAPEAVYADLRSFFKCRFLYLIGPPGAPTSQVAAHLEQRYGYVSIDVAALLDGLARAGGPEGELVAQQRARGKPVDASLVSPLILAEVYRGQAMGVNNFVLCDFPQSMKQVEFLEHQVPCVSKPLLLEFSRADAADLAGASSAGALAELQTDAYFLDERQAMIKALPGLVKIPLSLAEVESKGKKKGPSTPEGLEELLVEAIWEKVCPKVRPGLTLCLGMPFSGTDVLAPMLANMSPNTYAVDCNALLDKEMERRTDLGLVLSNMLAQGKLPPLSFTLELIKDVVNLTGSDSLVVENCPLYVDQIEGLSKEFRIDRVCHVAGDGKAMSAWRSKFLAQVPPEQQEAQGKLFGEHGRRLTEIVGHFSRLGKADKLAVSDTPTEGILAELLTKATMPQFVLVTGLSTVITPKVAELVAAHLNAGAAWSALVAEGGEAAIASLKKQAESSSSLVVVMDRCVSSEAAALAFLSSLGVPQLVVNVSCSPEAIEEEFKAAHDDMDEEVVAATLQNERTAYEGALKVFKEKCVSALLTIQRDSVKAPPEEPLKAAEQIFEMAKTKFVPKAYVVIAPSTDVDFGKMVTSALCTTGTLGSKPTKFTVLDTVELFMQGRHSSAIEDALHKASFSTTAPDCLPSDLWMQVFQEAFATSANPMGPFLITNFPTASALSASGTSIRDQFNMLGSLTSLGGILHVRLTDEVLRQCSSEEARALETRKALQSHVQDQISKQYSKDLICNFVVDDLSVGAPAVASKACATFLAFLGNME